MSLRSFALAGGLLAAAVAGAPAQSPPPPPLSFLGFEAGARLDSVRLQVRALGGRNLRCDQARRDRTVRECRATVFDPVSGQPIALWLSAMDSAAGVLTLSAPVTGEQLDNWRTELESSFGSVGARVEGPQWMMQWVRRGRMIRLTWRIDKGAKVASVSLIDGGVLDGWGRRRNADLLPVTAPDSAPARDSTAADTAGTSPR